MRTAPLAWFCWAAIGVFAVFATARGDNQADAKAALEKAGVRVLATGVALANEGDLSKELAKAGPLQRTMKLAATELKKAEETATKGQNVLNAMKVQQIQLNAGLAKVAPGDVATNNKIVGALQALDGQLDLGRQEKAKLDEAVKAAHKKYSDARDAFLQLTIAARKLGDTLEADYAKKANDPEIKANLVKLNAAAGKQFALAPGAVLTSALKNLKRLEDTIVSEAIELRSDGQRLWVTVFINGSQSEDLVLDSGASSVCLPAKIATKFGLTPTEKDPPVTLVMADGREIQGRLMVLKNVRVGKFEVEDVECVVLGENAVAAQALLGLTFLDNFKYEIDSAAKTLTMVKITDSAASTKGAK